MTYQLQQTDTLALDGAIAACSGLTADVAIDNRTAKSGGTPGTSSTVLTLTSADVARRDIHFETGSGDMDVLTCPAGNWVVRINITLGLSAGNATWTDLWICRVNSSGVSQQTIASTNTGNVDLTTGVKTMTLSGVSATFSPGDRIYIVVGFTNNVASNKNVTYKNDQLIDTPLILAATQAVPYVKARRAGGRSKFFPRVFPGKARHARTPKVSTAPPPSGSWFRPATVHRQAKRQPLFPIPILRAQKKAHGFRRTSTAPPPGGPSIQFLTQHRKPKRQSFISLIIPFKGKLLRHRLPKISTAPTPSGAWFRMAHRTPRFQGVARFLQWFKGKARRRYIKPPPPSVKYVRTRVSRIWKFSFDPPLRGKVKRRRMPLPFASPVNVGPLEIRRRVARGFPWREPVRGKVKRRRVPFLIATPPPSGPFIRWAKRLARGKLGIPIQKILGKSKRSSRIKSRDNLPVHLTHRQAKIFGNRQRPEPQRGRVKRHRLIAPARFVRRVSKRWQVILNPSLLRVRGVRRKVLRLPIRPLPSKRKPRLATRWRPWYPRSVRRDVPKIPVAPIQFIRRHRIAGKPIQPPAKGSGKRHGFKTLLTLVPPGPSPAPVGRYRRYLSKRWFPLPIRGKVKRRRLPQVPSVARIPRHRISGAIVRFTLPRQPWRKRKLVGIPAVLPTVIRARKRPQGGRFLAVILKTFSKRRKPKMLLTLFIPNPIIKRHRQGWPGIQRTLFNRGGAKRRRLPKTPSVPRPGRHRTDSSPLSWGPFLWRSRQRRKNWRTGLVPSVLAKPDIIGVVSEPRIWTEPPRSKIWREPRKPRIWKEPRRFVNNVVTKPFVQALSIADSSLPGATAGWTYSHQFVATGGTPPYTFSTPTALPSGLTFSASGVLSGTPTVSGPLFIEIDVNDSSH